jgi:molybdopterin-biosynthesis enzyme MoeA-like protein
MTSPSFSLIIIGDEILSGKRVDKHMPKLIELLIARGLALSQVHYVGDDPHLITPALKRAFESGDVVFCCGGIGATPDDHTRQCAARALGQDLVLHPHAEALIRERMLDTAREQGLSHDPDHPDNIHRLNMGAFPASAEIIPNPYNKIPGFSCAGQSGGRLYFMPGFPVMAWPMMAWVLDTFYAQFFCQSVSVELSVIIYGSMEAALTPLMEAVELQHPGIKVFSLPSVDHPEHGRHIELGVKGAGDLVTPAYSTLITGLRQLALHLGPELVRGRP